MKDIPPLLTHLRASPDDTQRARTIKWTTEPLSSLLSPLPPARRGRRPPIGRLLLSSLLLLSPLLPPCRPPSVVTRQSALSPASAVSVARLRSEIGTRWRRQCEPSTLSPPLATHPHTNNTLISAQSHEWRCLPRRARRTCCVAVDTAAG